MQALPNTKGLIGLFLGFYSFAMIILLIVALQDSVPISFLTKDPNAITDFPFYTGLVSNIGNILWTIAATICIYTFLVVKDNPTLRNNARFILGIGILTFLLMLDDQFLIHEEVFPKYLGLHKILLLVLYGIALMLLLVVHRTIVLQFQPVLLALPLFFFLVSVLAGKIDEGPIAVNIFLIKDGSKFLGIVGWFCYFSSMSLSLIHSYKNGAASQEHKPAAKLKKNYR